MNWHPEHKGGSLAIKVLMGMLGLILLGVLYLGFTMVKPYQLFTVKQVPWTILPQDKIVKPGGSIFVDIDVCKNTENPATIGLMIVGKTAEGRDYLEVLPSVSGWLPKGCSHKYTRITGLPIDNPPGKYRVVISISYSINALRTVSHRFVTDEFDVLGAKPKAKLKRKR